MKEQIIELSGQCPTFKQISRPNEKTVSGSYPDALFWMQVYPPMGDRKLAIPHAHLICPWAMAAELAGDDTPSERRKHILEALKSGLKTIRQYDLPAYRIMFAQEHSNHQIGVWVD